MDSAALQYDQRFFSRLRNRTATGGAIIFLIPFALFLLVMQFASERYVRRQLQERLQAAARVNAQQMKTAGRAQLPLHFGIGPSERAFLASRAGAIVSIADPSVPEGTRFARSQGPQLDAEAGFAEYRDWRGHEVLSAWHSAGNDVVVVVQVDQADLREPIRRLRTEIILYVLPFLLLGLVLAYFAWSYALGYIHRLMNALYQALQVARQRERERDQANRELAERFDRERELAREKARFQSQLAEYEKYAALAQLALGAAHEINNPLLGILSHLELELRSVRDPEVRSEIQQCIEGTRRIAATLRGLINYARPGPLRLSPVNLQRTVGETFAFLSHQPLFRGIHLENRVPGDLPVLTADANQLSQVLMNLLFNSAQAMPHGGEIRVEAEASSGETVIIRVMDTGEGISPEVLPHIFEPFYTTKRREGTGLGLSITQAYVRSHGGEIAAETVPGQGTVMRISLPVRQQAEQQLEAREVLG